MLWLPRDPNLSLTQLGLLQCSLWFIIWLVVWLPFLAFSQKYWVANHPNWLSYFSEGLKPPTSHPFSSIFSINHGPSMASRFPIFIPSRSLQVAEGLLIHSRTRDSGRPPCASKCRNRRRNGAERKSGGDDEQEPRATGVPHMEVPPVIFHFF